MRKDVTKTADQTKAVMVVTGMRSDNCASKVRNAINSLNGVKEVVVDWPRNEVIVSYNPDQIDTGMLGDAIKDVGYNVGGVI